ncbi:erythromycin esterase family protein [Flavobacterium frigoris]|uniref:Erythromycin esterase homolog n=1 Tax=Flavobacterium frigoris TaxID=229204 RepID=A0A1H9NEA5_FLAFI|nr:erythromycin esterase family protein [Flavobacterium frigoris]SER34181.1 Erythromycin esterase homolog [Flavobacterium frigoris]
MEMSDSKHKPPEILDVRKLIVDNSIELNEERDLDKLIEKIGDAKYVLLGEASHGTHEYYTWRMKISKKLIEKKGFSFIAVEGDWPDCYKLNRYVKNYPDSGDSALDVLHSFNRWPTWMWANWETVALGEWLRAHNDSQSKGHKVGFYGLDVYSLWESFDEVIKYLEEKDPTTRKAALDAFNCFEPYSRGEGQEYARAARMVSLSCEDEVVNLLTKIRRHIPTHNGDPEDIMNVRQNAQVIVNAERYYRAMVTAGPKSWNIRDRHMVHTLENLMEFHGAEAKGIIWEHNTHIGDARATDMADDGTVNVGQIINEEHKPEEVFSVGFGSYQGTVIAGREWGDVMQVMRIPEAVKHSWEYELHKLEAKDRIVFMTESMKEHLGEREFGHRAIGVVYRPQYEHFGNYVPSKIPYRYNAFIYLDETSALHPLHTKPDGNQMPETFPFGV